MKRKLLFLSFSLLSMFCPAQQNIQYTQFMLNDYGFNPATAGAAANGWMIMAGRRTQWRGFEAAPVSDFISVTKAFGKKGYRHFWHGIGIYAEDEQFGVFTSKIANASYTIHLKISSKYRVGFGVSAGIKNYAISDVILSDNDPALSKAVSQKIMVPDIVPGIYLYSKKISFGLAVRNLYQNKLISSSKQIGTGIQLLPTAYFTVSRKYRSGSYNFVYVPGVHIQTNFKGIPLTNVNFMAYYKNRVGLGLNYRIHDAASVILQVKVFSNFVIGIAYDYTVSRFRPAKANSEEIMLGYTPVMSSEEYSRPGGAADCPKFEIMQ